LPVFSFEVDFVPFLLSTLFVVFFLALTGFFAGAGDLAFDVLVALEALEALDTLDTLDPLETLELTDFESSMPAFFFNADFFVPGTYSVYFLGGSILLPFGLGFEVELALGLGLGAADEAGAAFFFFSSLCLLCGVCTLSESSFSISAMDLSELLRPFRFHFCP